MEKFLLYGPSGSGKSTIGPKLAQQLDLPFLDLDEAIEETAGRRVDQIFEQEGEAAFRRIESALLHEAIESEGGLVAALGGGALLDPASAAAARKASVLCLRARHATLLSRLLASKKPRPLLIGSPETQLQTYLAEREAHYDSFPLQLDTDGLTPAEAAAAAQSRLGAFRLAAMGTPYDVRLRRGSLPSIGEALRGRGWSGQACVVADENTRPYAETALKALSENGFRPTLAVIPAGEVHKTIAAAGTLWKAFQGAGLERGSLVVAVGGGMVGDLAGFAAATYLRGLAWAAVPTSLLAMVDASLGGKTGVDLPEGKNLVGAFHAPAFVLADPAVLTTLPANELRSGMAEVVKAGMIGDLELFEACRGHSPDAGPLQAEWIAAAAAVKIGIIEQDPYETGLREVLNFGHTLGHAVEHASGYRLLHGEAVAIGMAAETRLAERLGIAAAGTTRELRTCLQALGLPTTIPSDLDREAIHAAMRLDKKRRDGRLRFALPKRIGTVGLVEISQEDALSILPY